MGERYCTVVIVLRMTAASRTAASQCFELFSKLHFINLKELFLRILKWNVNKKTTLPAKRNAPEKLTTFITHTKWRIAISQARRY